MRKVLLGLLAALLVSPALADVIGNAPSASSKNGNGTVATGGTFQNLVTGSAQIKSFEFENICNVSGNCAATTDNCYLFWPSGSPTKATSLLVPPGAYYGRFSGVVPNDTIQVTCDGSSDKYWSETQ